MRRLAGRIGWTGLRALNRAGRLTREGAAVDVTLHGRAIAVPLWGGLGLDHGRVADEHLIAILRALLGLREGAFVDIGAHLGQTLVKLLVIGDGRPYLGFEPKPRAAAYVEALLAANGRGCDAVLAAAAGAEPGAAALAVAGDRDDSARLSPAPAAGTRPVPVVRGDDALDAAGIEAVGLLKLDAEGAELDALRGFERAIARDRPPVLCEILPFGSAADRERAAELTALLRGHGYAMFACGEDGSLRAVEAAAEDRSFAERDYAFVQEGDVDRLGDSVVGIRG